MSREYDYIVTGGGLAGLSLILRMLQAPALAGKKILLIESATKNKNDRTWCYWESDDGFFDPLVYRRYNDVLFYSPPFSGPLGIAPYVYKMLRGSDFYAHAYETIALSAQVELLSAKVARIANAAEDAEVILENGTVLRAAFVFNSILFTQPSLLQPPTTFLPHQHYLLQHFMGWEIETDEPVFDTSRATFMDFRTPQTQGTSFVYVLPLSPYKALIEYTLFTHSVLATEAYEQALKEYISTHLRLSQYQVLDIEQGIIPMTNARYARGEGRVINIGTAGGDTKASSGYTFQFVQKRCAALVASLSAGNHPLVPKSLSDKKYGLYDATLLHILAKKQLGGDFIFGTLFRKNPSARVLRFLDNESSFWEELQIMHSVPTGVFGVAAVKELWEMRR